MDIEAALAAHIWFPDASVVAAALVPRPADVEINL
jgi:hypothetical protein